MKSYKQSPLPFQGQKRRFAGEFKQALKSFKNVRLVVDLFGGSGLLSQAAKEALPDAHVIYNDYDDYHKRLAAIPQTNAILADIREMLKDYPREKRLPLEVKEKVLQRIKQENGFVDFITLSSSLLFSMNYCTTLEKLEKEQFYNNVRQSDFALCDDYLQGVEIVRHDYRVLFNRHRMYPGVVFIVDPPYLNTDVTTYTNYWRLANYLDVLNTLKDISYFYFTSNKSSILEFCEWMEKNLNAENPFKGASMKTTNNQPNYNAGYVDIMLYKEKAPL
jgi:hypothetical protein